jgi:hypothetical protein
MAATTSLPSVVDVRRRARQEEVGRMHAIVGIWSLDEDQREVQEHAVHHEMLPLLKTRPGFVSCYWMHDSQTGKGHATVVFDSEAHAADFKEVIESGASHAARAGAVGDILALVQVTAVAHASAS